MADAPLLTRAAARRAATWQRSARPAPDDAPGVVDLSQSYLADSPPGHIAAAAGEALDRGATHYVDRSGIQSLREAIAGLYQRERGWHIGLDEIVVTSGAQEALFLTLRSLMKPGDEVLAPDPGCPLLHAIARLGDGVVVPVPTAADGFRLKAARLAEHITPRSRFALLLSPNPATGLVIPPAEVEGIAALARRHDLIVVMDEALLKGIYDGVARAALEAQPGMAGRLVTTGSLSKLYRMSGWRIGWVIGGAPLVEPIRLLKQALSICSPSVSQWAALAALTGPQDWLSEQQAGFVARRDRVLQAMRSMGLGGVPPDAAYFVWVDVHSTGLSSEQFVDFAFREARVGLRAGSDFGPDGERFVRLSLTASIEQLDAALERLGRALRGR